MSKINQHLNHLETIEIFANWSNLWHKQPFCINLSRLDQKDKKFLILELLSRVHIFMTILRLEIHNINSVNVMNF